MPGDRYIIVDVDTHKSTKRARGGTPTTTTYKFFVSTGVNKTVIPTGDNAYLPPHVLVGRLYHKQVGDDADALWTAACKALKVQGGAPENLCVHCYGRTVWARTDTCIKCSLGLQSRYKVDGDTPIRVEDRKTPKPRP